MKAESWSVSEWKQRVGQYQSWKQRSWSVSEWKQRVGQYQSESREVGLYQSESREVVSESREVFSIRVKAENGSVSEWKQEVVSESREVLILNTSLLSLTSSLLSLTSSLLSLTNSLLSLTSSLLSLTNSLLSLTNSLLSLTNSLLSLTNSLLSTQNCHRFPQSLGESSCKMWRQTDWADVTEGTWTTWTAREGGRGNLTQTGTQEERKQQREATRSDQISAAWSSITTQRPLGRTKIEILCRKTSVYIKHWAYLCKCLFLYLTNIIFH